MGKIGPKQLRHLLYAAIALPCGVTLIYFTFTMELYSFFADVAVGALILTAIFVVKAFRSS